MNYYRNGRFLPRVRQGDALGAPSTHLRPLRARARGTRAARGPAARLHHVLHCDVPGLRGHRDHAGVRHSSDPMGEVFVESVKKKCRSHIKESSVHTLASCILEYTDTQKKMESATQCTAATLFEGVSIAPNSVFIGPGAALPGVSIEGDSVIYPDCTIGSGALIVKSAIAEGCTIGNGASLCEAVCARHCILGAGVTVKQGAKLGAYVWAQNGAVILENARVGSGCVIRAGAVVPAHAVIADHTVVYAKVEDPVLISECLQLMEEAHDDLCAVEVELDNYQKLCEVAQLKRENDSKQHEQWINNNAKSEVNKQLITELHSRAMTGRQAIDKELQRHAELRSRLNNLTIMLLMMFICVCLYCAICMIIIRFFENRLGEYLISLAQSFQVLCTDVQLWVQDLAGAGYEYFFSGSGLCSDGSMPLVL